MKTLIVYYSRTGTTKKAAETLQKRLNCDLEEIFDTKNRDGALGWMLAGRDAIKKILPEIKKIKCDPGNYDLVIIGTPVWTGTMAAAVRTYLRDHKHKLRRTAFFSTQGSGQRQKVFDDMEEFTELKPLAEIFLTADEVKNDKFTEKITEFINMLQA